MYFETPTHTTSFPHLHKYRMIDSKDTVRYREREYLANYLIIPK